MNRLGPPVSGGVLGRLGPAAAITGRLGPAVKNGQEGNKNGAPIANLAASKTNKAGQVFYNNQKVFFDDGKVFNASGKVLASGGKVNFQNGRLEYVVLNAPAKSPIKGSVKNRISVLGKSPITAPAKTPVKVPMKSIKSAPAKNTTAPGKSPVSAPAKKGGVNNRLGPIVNNGVQSAAGVNNKRKPITLGTNPTKKLKKDLKKEMNVPDIKNLVVKSISNVSPSMNSLELLCDVPGVNKPAILKLEKTPFTTAKEEFQAYLKSSSQMLSWQKGNRAKITLSNSTVNSNRTSLNSVNAILTYPAPQAMVAGFRKSLPPHLFRETPEFYREIVIPYIRNWLPANKPTDWEWIDTILKGTGSPDRIVDVYRPSDCPENGFTLVKDLEWVQQNPTDVSNLHILGIVHRKDIFCLRSLTAEHVPLLKALYHGGTSTIQSQYGVPVEDQVVFLQYYPSTFHLHVHYTTWGNYGKVGRLGQSHLLVEVISNLEDVDTHYYRKVTLNVLVDKDYEFLAKTQGGTSAIGHDKVDMPSNGMQSQQNVFKDPNDPFYQLQYSLMDFLTRFQDVLNGNLEFLRLPVKELMKNIMNQPRPLLESVLTPLRELHHHMNNRPLDHMSQLEGVLAELLQFFQKNPLQTLPEDPQQNRAAAPQQSDINYLRGYQVPRYR